MKDLKEKLNYQLPRVLRYLFPNGKQKGNEYCIGSISGEEGESLKIRTNGDKMGVWSDFSTGQSGDMIELWRLNRSISFPETISEVKCYLGISDIKIPPIIKKSWSKPKRIDSDALPGCIAHQYLLGRGISPDTINKYRIGCGSGKNQWIIFPYYHDNELVMAKYLRVDRPDGKKIVNKSKDTKPILFGWQAIPEEATSAVIVEGEIDCMTFHDYGTGLAIFSVPMGGGDGKKQDWIEHEYERLYTFETIYLCLDSDEEGKKASKEISKRLGEHRCKEIKLPCKDITEAKSSGLTYNQLMDLIQFSEDMGPQEIKSAHLYLDWEPSESEGYSSPWNKFNTRVRFRPGELSVWTGINGHGKSMVLSHIMINQIKEAAKIFIASLELSPERTVHRMKSQILGKRYEKNEKQEYISAYLEGNLWIYDMLGSVDSKRLLEVFEYGYRKYGIDVFVIDSFLKCGIAEDDFRAQKAFVESLCDFKNKYNVHVHLVAHPRKGIDESRVPGKLDVKGTGSITDLADNCFCVWRNREKESDLEESLLNNLNPQKQNESDVELHCDKQRHGDWEGGIGLWFDKPSYQYLETKETKPAPVIRALEGNK